MGKSGKPKLGQNFLVDEAAQRRIVEALGDVSGRTVVEIGPGGGALTDLLAARAGRLVAVEVDAALAAELQERYSGRENVEVRCADVLRTSFAELAGEGTVDVVGNLPYYITSDILLHLFDAVGSVRRAVLMMQREVAERVAAQPGVREYGLLSATTQLHAEVTNLFTLPPGAFRPPPEVYSSVLRLEMRPRFAELGVDREGFERFLRACFAQKRKTLANNLRTAGFAAEGVAKSWPAGISATARAEELSLEAMAELYRGLRG